MREIKFRAWDKKRNIMVGSDYPQNWGNHQDEWYADTTMMDLVGIESISKSKRFYLMQYTGLKDRNGKMIYEGDVVSYDGKGSEVVEYEDGCFWVGLNGELPAPLYAQMGIESMQVIGNIYENGDLLRGNS